MDQRNFTAGTISNKTPAQLLELVNAGARATQQHTEYSAIAPVVVNDEVAGYTLTHAEPKPRAPRADKGVPKGPRAGTTPRPETDAKAAEQAAPVAQTKDSGAKSPWAKEGKK